MLQTHFFVLQQYVTACFTVGTFPEDYLMKSRDYEYVLAISQEGSFSRAAQRLYITQPALSSAIKKLEKELYDVPLFDRSASPVRLTPEGQFWLEKARQIDALDNEIDEHFSTISGVLKGTISVGSSSYFCAYVLAEIIHRFREKHPGCRITLTECSFSSMEAGLRDGRLVLGIDVEKPDPSVFDVTELRMAMSGPISSAARPVSSPRSPSTWISFSPPTTWPGTARAPVSSSAIPSSGTPNPPPG